MVIVKIKSRTSLLGTDPIIKVVLSPVFLIRERKVNVKIKVRVRMKVQVESWFWSYLLALIKNKIKFSSYIRISRRDRLQSHIYLTASSYMTKYLRISSYIRKPFLICDFATDRSHLNFFLSVCP